VTIRVSSVAPAPFDLTVIDVALRLIDREIWVVTAADGERRGGLVATWVSSASIDQERPVLLAGIAPNHFTAELVQASGAFAAHLLRPDQSELAWKFASCSGRNRDKLAGLACSRGRTGSPLLVDCLAWFDCRVFARYDAGDRLFFWADVVGANVAGTGAPAERVGLPSVESGPSTADYATRNLPATLREQAFIRSLTDEQRRQLATDRNAELTVHRPLAQSWREKKPW
jgi:flavin reductase (DIM6/NTAB) family NADH-FMN oxidoreductase RutF